MRCVCVCAQGALVALKPIYKQKIDISKPLLMEIKKVRLQCALSLLTCNINSYASRRVPRPPLTSQPQPQPQRHVPISRRA